MSARSQADRTCAWVIGAAAVAVGLVVVVVAGVPLGGDTQAALAVAGRIASGDLTHLSGSGGYDALPLWPALLVPAALVGRLAGPASTAATVAVVTSSMLVAVPLASAVGTWAADAGVRRRWRLQAAVATLALVPASALGHPEDVLALAAAVTCLRSAQRDRWVQAAAWLGVALAAKHSVAPCAPFVLAATPHHLRLRAATAAAAVPGVLLAAVAVVAPAGLAPLRARVGWADGRGVLHGVTALAGPDLVWVVRPAELCAAVVLAAVLAGRLEGRCDLMVAAVTAALAARGALEPLVYPYYLVPGVVLTLALAARRAGRLRVGEAVAAAAVIGWAMIGQHRAPALWWAVVTVPAAVLAARAAGGLGQPATQESVLTAPARGSASTARSSLAASA